MKGDELVLATSLSEDRARVLKMKATLVVAVPAPQQQRERQWQWISGEPDVTDSDLTWVVDGSKRFGAAQGTATTGCGVAVIDNEGNLRAASWATPPQWIKTSYAAEVWALWLTPQACPAAPKVLTDCKAILGAMRAGEAAVTAGKRPLARVWKLICSALDHDVVSMATSQRINWMPSHTSGAAIVTTRKSNNERLTAAEWRANQLADALAKHGAPSFSTNEDIDQLYTRAAGATQQAAALLGAVTHAANNHKVLRTKADGTTVWVTTRDCTAPTKRKGGGGKSESATTATKPAAAVEVLVSSESDDLATVGQRRASARAQATALRRSSQQEVSANLASCAAATARPCGGPTASERLEAVRERFRSRTTGTLRTATGAVSAAGETSGNNVSERLT